MTVPSVLSRWLRWGRQKSAVAQVLRKPMTASEIAKAAQRLNSRLRLRDVWHLMRQFQERDLVACLNPHAATGKLYMLTDLGRAAVATIFHTPVEMVEAQVDWRRYGRVARARIRRLLLLGLAQWSAVLPLTASLIRRLLRDKHPLGLGPTVRGLKELEQFGLVKSQPVNSRSTRKFYQVTRQGHLIARQLLK